MLSENSFPNGVNAEVVQCVDATLMGGAEKRSEGRSSGATAAFSLSEAKGECGISPLVGVE